MRKHLSTFYFVFLSAVASFFNYAIYPVLSRVLGDAEFIQITVALALFTQLSSFMLSIVALTIGLSKDGSSTKSKIVIEKLQAVLTHLLFVIIFIFLALSPVLLTKLRLPASMLLPICAMLALSISLSIITGYLNGKQKLVKLGIALVLNAALQFVLSVAIAVTSKNGAATLNAMAFGSLLAVAVIYKVYASESLPRFSSIFTHGAELYRSKDMRKLIVYIVSASLATLVTNVLMVIDLLLVNNRQTDAKIYTDLYIISRIVFFGGMLFVWPFLSNLSITRNHGNIKLLAKLTAIFSVITGGAITVMATFGQQVTKLLLGPNHGSSTSIKQLAFLAIIYKFIFLVIVALTLFFIVVRSYWAVSLPIILLAAIGGLVVILGPATTTANLVLGLNIVSLVVLLIGIGGFMKINQSLPTPK